MTPLIYERDMYLTYQIRQVCLKLAELGQSNQTLVAVMGMGHVQGVVARLQNPPTKHEIDAILIIPPITSLRTYLIRSLVVSVVVVGGVVYGVRWYLRRV